MSDAVKLSICIPTHNFGAYIGSAIESALKHRFTGMEIVVLDSASSDQTRDVVRHYQRQFSHLHYHFQPDKRGIDADLARCIALASGEYCWLLSADDALMDGAIVRIVRELPPAYDVYLCNRIVCDRELRPQQAQSWLTMTTGDVTVRLDDDRDLIGYFSGASSIGALFSFMSSIVVRRESWMNSEPDARVMGTNYAHVQRLFAMGRRGGRLKYIAEPLVLCRTGNDSFLAQGVARRHLIDLRGFEIVGEVLFGSRPRLLQLFKSVLNKEHHWVTWVWLRSITSDARLWQEIRTALAGYGYSHATLMAMEILGRLPNGPAIAGLLRRYWLRVFPEVR